MKLKIEDRPSDEVPVRLAALDDGSVALKIGGVPVLWVEPSDEGAYLNLNAAPDPCPIKRGGSDTHLPGFPDAIHIA